MAYNLKPSASQPDYDTMDSPQDKPEWGPNRARNMVGVVIGLVALYFAGSWAKERFVDSDRMMVGVHAIDSEEAVVMYRYDGAEVSVFRIAKIRIDSDEPLWERDVGFPNTGQVGCGMSVAGARSVILNEVSDAQVEVTAHDLSTGEVVWQRKLAKEEGRASRIIGRDRFVLVQVRDRQHVLDRATGKTIHEREGPQTLMFAFTESWLEFAESTAIEYLEIESGRLQRIQDTKGPQCRIDGRVYGFDLERGLLSRNLATGEDVQLLPPDTRIADETAERFRPWSCGWRTNPDGSLRLLFGRQSPGLLVAIDLDPASPLGSGRAAWTHTFTGTIQTGETQYRALNRLDLVWSGEVPRFAPLEVRLASAPEGDEQIVVFDTEQGKLVRQGTPGDRIGNRFSSFKRGTTVFMVMEDRGNEDTPGAVLAMDGETGVTRAVTTAGDLRVEPPSVADGAAWAWVDTGFSRESNLAVTVLDRELGLVGTRNPKRAPVATEDVITSLLGTDPQQQSLLRSRLH